MSNDSKPGYGKAGRRLWHTPAADDPAIAVCRIACGIASCSWPAPPMPVSTTITSAKNWSRRKASRSGARPFADCCARPESARLANDALPPIASAASHALGGAGCCCSTPARTVGWKIAARSLLRRCGLPLSFYGDRHGVFVRNDEHWSVEEQLAGRRQPTQFGRALDQLGITYIAAQSPQAKGRIERLWGTFQDRLTSELRLARASDIASANQVLRRFLPDYNRRFGRAPRDAEKAWRPAPENLDRICCFRHERSVSNDNVGQWDGRRFQIPPQPHRFSFAGAKVQLYESLEGKVSIYYADTKLRLTNG